MRPCIAILANFPWSALDSEFNGRGAGHGGCTWLPQLADGLAAFPEFDIHWVIIDRKDAPAMTRSAHGQHFHRIKGVSATLDAALADRPTRWMLRAFLRVLKPDIVHAWGTELIYPAALQDFKGPTILSMQGVLTEYQRIGGLPENWWWRRLVAREPSLIRSATVVTSESAWGIERVKKVHSNADCRLIEYGVHPGFFEASWQPSPEVPYVLYAGGSDARKGFDVLIAAMQLLPDRNWELRIAGDTAVQSVVEDAGLSKVRCLGLLAWDELQRELQGAWAFVLPTRGDTSPNSVKEARVVGVPVVTTRHGGQAGYIRDGINGRLVDPLGPESLAEALKDVMSSFGRAGQLGAGRHQEDRDYLRPQRTDMWIATLYQELAATCSV